MLWAAASGDAKPSAAKPSAAKPDSDATHDHSAHGAHHESPAGDHADAADAAAYDLFHARSLDGGRTFGAADPDRRGMGDACTRRIAAPIRRSPPPADRVVAVWTSPGTSKWGTGPLAVAVSNDGGRTWSRGGNPADDNSTDGHGFIDVAADPAGGFHAVWLDGRDGDSGLRVASSADGVVWRPNANVDAVTCQCCWNDLAVLGPGRLAVLYRDRDPRDMAVAVTEDGARSWERRGIAGEFGWKVDGCPHVGGGLADVRGRDHPRGGVDRRSRSRRSLRRRVSRRRTSLERAARAGWTRRAPRRSRRRSRRAGGGVGRGRRDLRRAIGRRQDLERAAPSQRRCGARASHPLVVATASGALVLWTESGAEDGESAAEDGESSGEDGSLTRWASVRL